MGAGAVVVVDGEETGGAGTAASLLDHERLSARPKLYALLVLLGSTRLDMLRLLPWRAAHHAGFPSARLLLLAQASVVLEDLPQAAVHACYR